MFHIGAVAAWNPDSARDLPEQEFPRASILAAGAVVHRERFPGAVLVIVTYGTPGRAPGEQIRADRDAKIAMAGTWRLDNLDELRAALPADAGASEAAVFLAAYRQWGADFAARFKGDFSGIIWDWGRRRLLGFRDQLGVRPLFHAPSAGRVAVASDVELLLSMIGDAGAPDDQMIVEYLAWQFHSVERTFWSGVRRLPAGHVLDAVSDKVAVRPFWHPPEPVASNPKTVYESFRALFFQSVRRRLVSDGAVLAHLSGGIDSSSIVCVADRICREDPERFPSVRTVSARYPGLATDEGQYIEAVTRSLSLQAESWDGRGQEHLDLSDPSLAGPGYRNHRADDTADEFKIARRVGATTILSGQGGDQLGAPSGLSEHLARVRPLWFGWQILSPEGLSWTERARRAKFLVRALAPDPLSNWWAGHRARRAVPPWLDSRWRDLIGDIQVVGIRRSPRAFRSFVQEIHWRDLMGGAMGQSLEADHRISTRWAVEMRYPFLDLDLVNFVLTLPPEDWPMPQPYVRLQRTALADLLPEAVLGRTQKAFFSPVVALHMKSATARLRTLFFDGRWASERWVSRRGAQQLLEHAISVAADAEWPDWQAVRAIATLEAWLRRVFGYDTRSHESAAWRKS